MEEGTNCLLEIPFSREEYEDLIALCVERNIHPIDLVKQILFEEVAR